MMRLFAAIPLGGEVQRSLAGLLDRWTRRDWPVRWVRPQGLHLTVKFLGSIEPERLAAIAAGLGRASAGTPGLTLGLRELGAFPSFERARVLWAGLDAEPALELLVDRVERAMADLGFPLEGRAFRPHVTLGRLKDGARLPPAAIREIEDAAPGGSCLADRLVLYESRPGPGGSVYGEQASFPLEA
jgi:2'-5' RNA ligase